jgi:hypothetical protein
LQHRRPFGELHPLETPSAPWDTISVDFIVELPKSHGYDAIMNVVDSVTKRAHFIPTHTTITAKGAACLYLREVWKHHGMPRVVVSDRGSQFTAGFTCELYKLLGIELATSMAYHPQTDGQTEHVNQELEGYLHIFTSRRQDDWDDLLPLGELSHNNNIHSSAQQTPFMVDTRRHPHMGFEPHQPRSELESVNEFAECMAQGLEEAKSAISKVKDEYAMYYNRRREPPHFRRLHPVFPMVKLSITHPDPIPGRRPAPPPPPTLIDGEDKYEVEAILDSWMCYNHLEYLVKWKGYDESHNQWEEHTQLHAQSKIAQFHRKNPGAARHINAAIFNSIPFTRVDLATSS